MLTVEYYTATWCGPCKAFGPTMDSVMAEKGVNGYKKIDVDNNRELAIANNVSSVPTIIFKVGDEIVSRQTGAMSRAQLIAMVDRFNG
jgi:thiol-disulfide isomerase/thioredoxin